jgi:predicted aspartyl protease
MKVSVPFNQRVFREFRLFVVPVLIENHGRLLYTPMIVDSGASYVTVRPDVFAQLEIPPLRNLRLVTASGETVAPLGQVERVTVGTLCPAEKIDVISVPFPETLPAEGLLGASFLRYFPVSMDFERGILELDSSP